jgi:hypothetical protein
MGSIYSRRDKSGAKVVSGAIGFILALAAVIATAETNLTQQALTPAEKAAIETVAAHASSGPDNIGQMLNGIGYNPDIPGFKAFPVVRKIEAAYLAAEQGTPGSGQLVIALLSKQIGNKYESARQDPTLRRYAALSADPTQLKFVEATSRPKPGPQVTKAVATLADYADGNALGGPQGVLRDYFGLPADRVYDILRNSDSTAAAITKGINWVPESQRRRKLSDLVAEIDRAYDGAAMTEASLNEYRPKPTETKVPAKPAGEKPQNKDDQKPHDNVLSPIHDAGNHPPNGHFWSPDDPLNPYTPPNPASPGGGGGGAGGGGSGESLSMANEGRGEENFGNFVGNRYTNGSSEFTPRDGGGGTPPIEAVEQGVFEAIVEGEGGFGGIVFGNRVVETPGLGKLVSLTWIPAPDDEGQQTGRIVFDFQQASQGATTLVHRFYGPVLLEDAYAAYRIVYSHEGLPEWSNGQGIGIMSLYDREDYIDCDANRPANHSVYWRSLLNPALLNTDLGKSAETVDSLPIVPNKFAAMIAGDDTSELSRDVGRWLMTTPGTWKFIDRPMVIGSIGERITIRPTPRTNLPGDETRFIDVRPFEEDPLVALLQSLEKSRESPFTAGFARLFPQIVRGSHEFSRINGFAPVLALFRWAKLSNATVMGSFPVPVRIPTPEALLIAGSTIVPAKDLPPNQIRELDRANIDKCLSAITAVLPAPQAGILTHEQSIWKQAALQLEPAADAGAAMQLLLDRSEYIENLARIAARDTPAGRALLTKLAKAKLEADASDDDSEDGNSLGFLTRLLVERFSSKQNLKTYDDLQKQLEVQGAIVKAQFEASDEVLHSALDDMALAKTLMDTSTQPEMSQYHSMLERESAATSDLKNLDKERNQLKRTLADAAASCVQGLSPTLQNQFQQIKTHESKLTFLSKHCVAWEDKSDQAVQQYEDIMKRRQKADDARSAVEEELRDFVKATTPTIGLWREFSTSYVPISHQHQELEKQWPHYADHTQDQQTDVAKNPPASE